MLLLPRVLFRSALYPLTVFEAAGVVREERLKAAGGVVAAGAVVDEDLCASGGIGEREHADRPRDG